MAYPPEVAGVEGVSHITLWPTRNPTMLICYGIIQRNISMGHDLGEEGEEPKMHPQNSLRQNSVPLEDGAQQACHQRNQWRKQQNSPHEEGRLGAGLDTHCAMLKVLFLPAHWVQDNRHSDAPLKEIYQRNLLNTCQRWKKGLPRHAKGHGNRLYGRQNQQPLHKSSLPHPPAEPQPEEHPRAEERADEKVYLLSRYYNLCPTITA
jgi:hypothetical protein